MAVIGICGAVADVGIHHADEVAVAVIGVGTMGIAAGARIHIRIQQSQTAAVIVRIQHHFTNGIGDGTDLAFRLMRNGNSIVQTIGELSEPVFGPARLLCKGHGIVLQIRDGSSRGIVGQLQMHAILIAVRRCVSGDLEVVLRAIAVCPDIVGIAAKRLTVNGLVHRSAPAIAAEAGIVLTFAAVVGVRDRDGIEETIKGDIGMCDDGIAVKQPGCHDAGASGGQGLDIPTLLFTNMADIGNGQQRRIG